MALSPCPECQKDVSDKAPTCPHCGVPLRAGRASRRKLATIAGVVLVAALAAGALALALRRPDYAMVERLRAEQDAQGTHAEHVRQRFFRLYSENPRNAMYIYLWARCVDDPQKQLDLASEGIRADPHFSWSYNMASRALARLNRIPEAYDEAVKGAALDPGNMQLANKQKALKLMMDHKLTDQAAPAPNAYSSYESKEAFERGAVRYHGLFRPLAGGFDRADLQAMEKSRLADYKGSVPDAVQGFMVCANPFADACTRTYVPRDARFKTVWMHPSTEVRSLHEHQLIAVAGSVVTNGKGENILLADAVTVEAE
jgi:hypothetical protein